MEPFRHNFSNNRERCILRSHMSFQCLSKSGSFPHLIVCFIVIQDLHSGKNLANAIYRICLGLREKVAQLHVHLTLINLNIFGNYWIFSCWLLLRTIPETIICTRCQELEKIIGAFCSENGVIRCPFTTPLCSIESLMLLKAGLGNVAEFESGPNETTEQSNATILFGKFAEF